MIPYLQAEQISKRWAETMLFENISFPLLARNSDSVHCLQNKHNNSAEPSNARTTSPRELGGGKCDHLLQLLLFCMAYF